MFRRALTFSLAVGFILIFSDALHAGFTSFTEYRAKLKGSGTIQSYTSYIQQNDDVRSIDVWSPFSSSSSSGSSSSNSSGISQYIPWSVSDYLDNVWSGASNKNNSAPISYLVSSSSFQSYTDYIKDLRGDDKDKKDTEDKDKNDKNNDDKDKGNNDKKDEDKKEQDGDTDKGDKDKGGENDKDRDHWNRKKDWDKDYWDWYKKNEYKDRHNDDDQCNDWYDGCKDDWHHDCDPPSHQPEPTSLAMLLGAGSTGLFGRYLRRRVKRRVNAA